MAANGFPHAASVIALVDSACGYAWVCGLPKGAQGFTTAEIKDNYLGSAMVGEAVSCTAHLAHAGRSTQVWDAEVVSATTGKTMALFRCSQMVLWPRQDPSTGPCAYGARRLSSAARSLDRPCPDLTERWLSGRKHRTRNAACLEGHRGFESHPLRQRCLISLGKSADVWLGPTFGPTLRNRHRLLSVALWPPDWLSAAAENSVSALAVSSAISQTEPRGARSAYSAISRLVDPISLSATLFALGLSWWGMIYISPRRTPMSSVIGPNRWSSRPVPVSKLDFNAWNQGASLFNHASDTGPRQQVAAKGGFCAACHGPGVAPPPPAMASPSDWPRWTPGPNATARKPSKPHPTQCAQQNMNDSRICSRESGDAWKSVCLQSASDREAHCIASDGEVGWPPLQTHDRR